MKKILMIGLLFLFIIILGIVIVKIQNSSIKKQNEIANANQDNNTTIISKTGANRKSSDKVEPNLDNIIEIKDNFFIESVNDVYLNLKDYIGKTIKMEGLIYSYQDYYKGDTCYAVIRNTPGCCGNDGLAGLDIRYNGDYPEENTWVEIIGVIGEDSVNGSKVPVVLISSIKEKEPGTTFVTN